MSDLILHHYPNSPFAEKVRLMLGFKGLPWRSVTIPRWMPKPDLVPLTGGYRKTPVLQVGADIYCDSACIARELEARFPAITLFPAGARGTSAMLGAWADRSLFFAVVAVVFGTHGDSLPQALKDDRMAFSGGAIDADKYKADQPHLRAQLRAHLWWLEHGFGDGRAYVLGPKPCYADFCVYAPVWMLQSRVSDLGLMEGMPRLADWYQRMSAVGHGMSSDMAPADALEVALAHQPAAVSLPHAVVADGLVPGTKVTVAADDYGKDPVSGYLLAINAQRVVVRRGDARVGEVNVHFPRAGYRVTPA